MEIMDAGNRRCQNCKNQFTIESEDFDFYTKIKVPPPTWCPECRLMRRFTWRNEWKLFKKKDIHGKEIFSFVHAHAPVKIRSVEEWYSDSWDSLEYGRPYNFSKPFFSQFSDLLQTAPVMSRSLTNPVHSDYCTNATDPKDCYMSFGHSYLENSAYSIWGSKSKDIFDCHVFNESESCYDCVNISKCYQTLYSVDCDGCSNVWFSKSCIGCNDCFGCVNLRNKSYHIFNQSYSKGEYIKKLKDFNLELFSGITDARERARELWEKFPNKYIHGRYNSGVSGDYIQNSKNANHCWRIVGGEDVKFCQNFTLGPAKDSYDHSNFGDKSELIYESLICGNSAYDVQFSFQCYPAVSHLRYCGFCQNSSYLFGCVGVRNKQYCILNKQYSKEEYEDLVPKIIQHMNVMPYTDTGGRIYAFGEFFPSEFSFLAYNESFAYENFPLSKADVEKRGLLWREPEQRNYHTTKSVADLPQTIGEVKDKITSETISCPHAGTCEHECTTAFRFVLQELQFYRKLGIPLPQLCPNCRHYERFKWRNPPRLWHRACMCQGSRVMGRGYENAVVHFHGENQCPNDFETSYAPDKPEIVYCEQCYNAEVV